MDHAGPLADPVSEARRLIAAAAGEGLLWRLRSQVGDKVRWYQQPEEEGSQDGARP